MRRLNGRTIFLVDGLGALLTACCLGVLLHHEDTFGMPTNYLSILIILASLFSMYALSCYSINPLNWKTCLKPLAILNLVYCGLTIFFVLQNTNQLSALGYGYFMAELTAILALAFVEIRVATRRN